MKRFVQLAPFVLLLACGLLACASTQNPEPQTPPAAEAEAPATPEPAQPAPTAPPAPVAAEPVPAPADPAMAAAQQDAAARDAEWAKMEATAQQESARFTPELHAKAKTLAETKWKSTATGLKAILASEHRAPGNAARDAYRHPAETLGFFGLKPTMTVLEYGPGEGWYTEVLAPLLAAKGKLIVTNGDPNGSRTDRSTFYARRFQLFLDKAPELFGKVETARTVAGQPPGLGIDGTVDLVVLCRETHGMINDGTLDAWLAQLHKALKPNGVLGVEQHRAKPGSDPIASAKNGYVPEAWLISTIEKAGFKLLGKSEVNANPKDTTDWPKGVWTLPPTYRLGDVDKDKYTAIGESDRMTLKFKKVEAKQAKPAAGSEPAAGHGGNP